MRFFAELNNAGCLLISEVKYLLENRHKDVPDTTCLISYRRDTIFGRNELTALILYNKTLVYVKTFAKFNMTDSASAVQECVLDIVSARHGSLVFLSCRTLHREPQL